MAVFSRFPQARALPDDTVVDVVSSSHAPTLTVLMPLFRQEAFVAEAVESVLAQQEVVCEIIVSDDASGDRTLEIALDVVRAHRRDNPHTVRVRRGTTRLRRAHVPVLVQAATTPIVAQAHGDDVALPHRMRELQAALDDDSSILAASPFVTINEEGHELDDVAHIGVGTHALSLDDALARPPWLIGLVQAWRPARLSVFPPLDLSYAPLGHDRILPIRAALLGGARAVGQPLVRRRVHRDNWSKRIVDTSDWRTKKHGWNLARIMVLDVVFADIDAAEAAGAITARTATTARDAVVDLRSGHSAELRAQHADLVARGRRLMWVDDEADG